MGTAFALHSKADCRGDEDGGVHFCIACSKMRPKKDFGGLFTNYITLSRWVGGQQIILHQYYVNWLEKYSLKWVGGQEVVKIA